MGALPVPSPALAGETVGGGARRVLVVDDDRHIVRLVQVNLQRRGYEVLAATSVAEALRQVHAAPPHLIVLDVTMPSNDAFTLVRELKRDPATCSAPVVMMVCDPQEAEVFRGWGHGIDTYIMKPFNPADLVELVGCMVA